MKQDVTVPVFVYRWFPEGAGYAHDARLDEASLTAIISALDAQFRARQDQAFRQTLPDGRCLIGERLADTACLDPRAQGRHPYILRAAVVAGPLEPSQEEALRAGLAALPLPARAGVSPAGLALTLPVPRKVRPSMVDEGPGVRRVGPFLAFGLLAALEVGLFAAREFGASTEGLLVRLGALLMVLGLYFLFVPSGPSGEALDELELTWSELPRGESTRIVLPEGRELTTGGWLPRVVRGPEYESVTRSAGMVLISGRETVDGGSGERVVRFVRGYLREGRTWTLALVQWTLEASQAPSPAPRSARGVVPEGR